MERPRAVTQAASLPATLYARWGGWEGARMKNVAGREGNGDRYTCTDYALPPLEVLKMFLSNSCYFP